MTIYPLKGVLCSQNLNQFIRIPTNRYLLFRESLSICCICCGMDVEERRTSQDSNILYDKYQLQREHLCCHYFDKLCITQIIFRKTTQSFRLSLVCNRKARYNILDSLESNMHNYDTSNMVFLIDGSGVQSNRGSLCSLVGP